MELNDVANLHRVTMALGAGEDSVRAAIDAAVTNASCGAQIVAKRLISGALVPGAEAVILFCVEGLSDTKTVFVLTDAPNARKEHEALIDAGTALRYAVCYRAVANDGSTPHLESKLKFGQAPTHDATTKDPSAAAAAGSLSIITFDVRPPALSMPSRRLTDIVHRQTAATAHADGTVELLKKGMPGADVDGAASGLCAWIVETLALIDAEYDVAIAEAFKGYRASTTDPKHSPATLTLGVVEALLQRHSAVQALLASVSTPESSAEALARHGCTTDYTGTAAQGALRQRVAGVHVAARIARRDAWCLVPLLKPLMALKLWDTAAMQSVTQLAIDVAEQASAAMLLSAALAPRPPSQIVHSGFFMQTLLPLLTADFLSHATALTALDGGHFLPKELGRSASLDVPAIDSELAPRVLTPAVQSAFDDAWWLLSRWYNGMVSAATIATQPDFALSRSALSDVGAVRASISGAHYACDRIRDLLRMTDDIKREGCGLLPPPVMCLFATIHQAAQAFPLLSAHQFLNWQLFVDTVMARAKVLKYTEVDPHRRYAEHVAPVTTPTPLQPIATAGHSSDPVMDAAVDEERALLRTRVVLLTAELNDCRNVLSAMSQRVEVAENAAVAARSEVEALKEELSRLRLSQQQHAQTEPTA